MNLKLVAWAVLQLVSTLVKKIMSIILKGIKRFRHPTYTASQWQSLNPFLQKGEVGFVLDSNDKASSFKVGPGYWNDLEFLGEGFYPYTDLVTNPIGDLQAGSSQEGRSLSDIIKDMISPYAASAVSGLQNNAQGSYQTTAVIEVGNQVSGTINITFVISNQGNLFSGDNLNIEAGGIFSNEGWSQYSGVPVALPLVTPLSPAFNQTFSINVKVKHEQGESAVVTTSISFRPRLIWGNSSKTSLTAIEFASIGNYNQVISNSYKRDYAFSGTQYHYLGIPEMLNITNPIFTDVTDPNQPAGIGIEDLGLLSVNNGVGTYNYRIYRSTFNLLNPVTIRVQ